MDAVEKEQLKNNLASILTVRIEANEEKLNILKSLRKQVYEAKSEQELIVFRDILYSLFQPKM